MKENDLTTHNIGLALHASGLHPYVKGRPNHFGVYRGGDDYEVLTDRLPEVYIWKIVPQNLFDWRDDKRIQACAMNLFNAKPFPVRVLAGYDTLAFVLNTETVSGAHFSARIMPWLDQIDEALDLFGQCSATIVRDWEKDDIDELARQLSNLGSVNPWLKGPKAS